MNLRILATTALVCGGLILGSCGGGSSSASRSQQGPLAGNWQIILTQGFPFQTPPAILSVSGFLLQSGDSVSGSVELPGSTLNGNCAGVGLLTATVSSPNIAISVDESGSTMSLTGAVSSDNQSMSGTYETLAGGCSDKPTSGTWTALKVPSLSLQFSGQLLQSAYMQLLTGMSPPAPIVVSGRLTQSANIGSSNAMLTGTISAVGYPCFRTASLTGTISGANVVLSVIGYQGTQIGTIGTALAPAIVAVNSGQISLSGNNSDGSGLTLGAIGAGASFGPCPALPNGGISQPTDTADVAFTFE
jgi:hypothetical protein